MLEDQEINRKLDMHMEMERLKAIENHEASHVYITPVELLRTSIACAVGVA